MKRLTGSSGTLLAFGLIIVAVIVVWLIFSTLLFLIRFVVPVLVVIGFITWLVVRKRER